MKSLNRPNLKTRRRAIAGGTVRTALAGLCASVALAGSALHATSAEAQSFSAPGITVTEGQRATVKAHGPKPPYRTSEFYYLYRTVDGTAKSTGDCPNFQKKRGALRVDSATLKTDINVLHDCERKPDMRFTVKFTKVRNKLVENAPLRVGNPVPDWYRAWPNTFEVTVKLLESNRSPHGPAKARIGN